MKKVNGIPMKARGRPRAFDRDTALERAMEVFWRLGFEGASVHDLTVAMGINPPSLYAAFGDKERLFLEAVQRYQAKQGAGCPYEDAPTAREAVERLLTYTAGEFSKPSNPRGCLLVMAATTSASCSAQLQAALAQIRAEAKARLKDRIDQGLREGELSPGTDTVALADFYVTVLGGMSLHARDGATRKRLMAIVAGAMRAWPDPPMRAPLRSTRRPVASRRA